jgi:hypothetical protein
MNGKGDGRSNVYHFTQWMHPTEHPLMSLTIPTAGETAMSKVKEGFSLTALTHIVAGRRTADKSTDKQAK